LRLIKKNNTRYLCLLVNSINYPFVRYDDKKNKTNMESLGRLDIIVTYATEESLATVNYRAIFGRFVPEVVSRLTAVYGFGC